VFNQIPGRTYDAEIISIPSAVGEGQFATSGALAGVSQVGMTGGYVAGISTPRTWTRPLSASACQGPQRCFPITPARSD
jgi:hypothetical protein